MKVIIDFTKDEITALKKDYMNNKYVKIIQEHPLYASASGLTAMEIIVIGKFMSKRT